VVRDTGCKWGPTGGLNRYGGKGAVLLIGINGHVVLPYVKIQAD